MRSRNILYLKLLNMIVLFTATLSAESLWGVYEQQITNSKKYSNPFADVKLTTIFTAPSGKKHNFRGFYDGDGKGGQSGNVWKIRFLPNETGIWKYSYQWSDGTAGGNGTFTVAKGDLKGPLVIDTINSWYFSFPDGEPFHARPYGLHHLGPSGAASNAKFPPCEDWTVAFDTYKKVFDNDIKNGAYNLLMIDCPSGTTHPNGRCYWLQKNNSVFDLAVWNEYEKIIAYAAQKGIYLFPFDGLAAQNDIARISDLFLEYYTARFGSFYNFMGYSPTWEYTEIWTDATLNTLMTKVKGLLPYPILLSAHDHSAATFKGWMGFSMRQLQAKEIFTPNNRTGGNHGGVESPFDQQPIIGSEDLWEGATYGNPANATEVRRAAWGAMLAGVMGMYSEWHNWAKEPGALPGEPEFLRMLNFMHTQTNYRSYQQKNSLVSAADSQICSGTPSKEYLVYDQNGGPITIDLSSEKSTEMFSVLWFNPTNGTTKNGDLIKGGARVTIQAPAGFTESVLLLRNSKATSANDFNDKRMATAHTVNKNEFTVSFGKKTPSAYERFLLNGRTIGSQFFNLHKYSARISPEIQTFCQSD